jgi:Holliday junction resolvase RusA-like endonuclease
MNELVYKGEFCGKPRMTRKDKWQTRPATARYWAFKDMINIAAKEQGFKLGNQFEVQFFIQMPASWSKKKKSEYCGKPHQQKPDLDNYAKALMDSLLPDDSCVWSVWAVKYWWYENKIIVRNFEEPIVN